MGNLLFVSNCTCYLVLCTLFLCHAPDALLFLVGAVSLSLSALLLQEDRTQALLLAILVTHIGPIVRITLPAIGLLTFGDLFLVEFTVVFAAMLLKQGAYLGPYRQFIWILLVLFVLNVLLSPDIKAVSSGALNLIQIALIYLFTINFTKDREDAKKLIAMIGFTVLVGAILHIVSYAQGTSLMLADLTQDENLRANALAEQRDLAGVFYKSEFFYGSFIASCTVAIILSLRHILLPDHPRTSSFLFWTAVMVAAVASSLVSGNRTPLVSAAVVGGFIFVTSLLHAIKNGIAGVRRLSGAVAAMFLIAVVSFVIQYSTLREVQRQVFFRMFWGDIGVSGGERLDYWQKAFERLPAHPKELFIGIGPDVPVKGPNLPIVKEVMTMGQLQVPSFHNFYLDVIFQHGIFFFAIVAFIACSTILLLLQQVWRRADYLAYDCLFAIMGWLLLWNSHATGWSKPVMILAQLFAISHLILAGRLGNRETTPAAGQKSGPSFSGTL